MRDLAALCDSRACVYRLLSRCYEREVDAAFAAEVADGFSFSTDDEALAQGFEAMRSHLVGCDEASLEELAVVFDRVFFGMGPRAAQKAFPYESVYTSDKGLMMQDAYSDAVRVYRSAGFAKNADFSEPEDHIAVELAFVAAQLGRASEALRAGDAEGAEEALRSAFAFARGHLLNWVDRFAADVEKAAGEGFYRDLAAFTVAYLRADEAVASETLS